MENWTAWGTSTGATLVEAGSNPVTGAQEVTVEKLPKIPIRCPKCNRIQQRKPVPVGMRLACSYCATIFVFYAPAASK